jgi:hypothetical protein
MADHNGTDSHPEQGMIKPWQASKIFASVQPSAAYLIRLPERMEKAGLKREKLLRACVSGAQRNERIVPRASQIGSHPNMRSR